MTRVPKPDLRIDRCVCHDVTFERALEVSKQRSLSLDQLADELGCTTGCGSCEPYLRRCLATGQVVFHEIIED